MKQTIFSVNELPSGKKLTVFEIKGWHFFKTGDKVRSIEAENKLFPEAKKETDFIKILISISVLIDGKEPSMEDLDNLSFADIGYISEVVGLQCKSLNDF